ncbi:hypothetical protein A2U01_0116325, partial [Trifolium medium]|nr:hypothetical protein [Trifolium medium]
SLREQSFAAANGSLLVAASSCSEEASDLVRCDSLGGSLQRTCLD